MAIGSVQLAKGRQAEAEAAFRQAVVVNPKSIPAHLAQANFYWITGNRAEAERSVRTAISVDPASAPANRALSVILVATGRIEDAEGPLRTVAAAGAPGDRLSLADYLVARKKFADARTLLTALKQEKAAAAAAGARLAGIEYEEGHRDRAYQLVDEVIASEPGNIQMRVLKGGWLIGERRLNEASVVAQDMLKMEPRSADAHGMLGSIYVARGQADEAIAEFAAVIGVAPKAVSAKVQLAQLYLAKGEARRALDLAQESVTLAPTSAVAHMVLARALLTTGDSDRALSQLRPLAETATKEPDVHLLMGQIQLRRRDYAGARQSFERALTLNPGSVESLEGLVAAELGGKAKGDAVAVVDARVAQRPRDASMLLLAGRTHVTVGDLPGAEALLKRAIDADPGLMAAYHVLGQVYVRQSKLDAALAEYQALALKNPKLVPAQTMVALLLHAQNRLEEARERYETVLAIDPHAAVAANNVAYIDAEAGRNLNVALSRAQTAKAALPDDPDVNDTLGWVLYKQGLSTSAIPPLEQSVAKDGNNPTYRYHLGMAYWKSGNTAKARESLERALKLNDKFDGAADARKVLASLQS
jgi:tetratricopeptide (TPR) repeat protein